MSSSNNLTRFLPVLAIFIIGSCTPPPTTSVDTGPYSENLSVHRTQYVEPSYTSSDDSSNEDELDKPFVAPVNHIKDELDSIFRISKKKVRNVKYIDGLTIQIYTGNNRERANLAKRQVFQSFEDLVPRISYDQPNYKVRVGKYYNRLDANLDFTMLKKEFPQAILVPDRILIETQE